MKIYLDTANMQDIRRLVQTGIIDGVTTNPTLLSKENSDPKKAILEICSLLPKGKVSVEVTETDPEKVYAQAKKITDLAPNILVKIPCHIDYYAVIKKLVAEKAQINVTLVFSLMQALYMCKLGVYCISPFIGRLDDIGQQGENLLHEIRQMININGYETELLAASIRSVADMHSAILADADILTVPVNVFEKSVARPLTDIGMKRFLADWKKLQITKFP